ncbi:MAG: hypothetical protein K8I30_05035 [Anaerolineae bacterium]|nr:hypothetical protein [Anaerolineae bacterium]
MVRKRDRVIATLIVWIGVLVAMAVILGRLTGPGLEMQNFWYYSGSVVTGGSSEEAMQVLDGINKITNDLQMQTRQYAQAELMAYLPYIVLLSAFFLAGGMLSTFFIWRSVVVPGALMDKVNLYKEIESEPRAVHLDDDGELVHMVMDAEGQQHNREAMR